MHPIGIRSLLLRMAAAPHLYPDRHAATRRAGWSMQTITCAMTAAPRAPVPPWCSGAV